MAVGMRDVGPCEAEYPRIAGERPTRQFRQLAVEARRKIDPYAEDLRLHNVVVVEQPFRRRRDASPRLDLDRAGPVGLEQDRCIVDQPAVQGWPSWRPRADCLHGRERLRMLLEPFAAEQLLP